MNMFFILFGKIFLLCVSVTTARTDVSYCDPNICPPGLSHVACGQDIAWNARCPDDAEFVEFTPELQQITLDAHNKLRNQLAMGQTPRYPPASRMATMTWDSELAELAKYNTMQCKMDHDECHSTRLFWMAGQNLAEYGGGPNDTFMADFGPNFWFAENPDNSLENIRSFNDLEQNGKMVGHFTQVVKDDSFKVGCSIAKYNEPRWGKKSLMACNYGVGNLQDHPIYQEGETASGCTSGTNPKFPGLCSENEMYEAVYIRRNF